MTGQVIALATLAEIGPARLLLGPTPPVGLLDSKMRGTRCSIPFFSRFRALSMHRSHSILGRCFVACYAALAGLVNKSLGEALASPVAAAGYKMMERNVPCGCGFGISTGACSAHFSRVHSISWWARDLFQKAPLCLAVFLPPNQRIVHDCSGKVDQECGAQHHHL